MFKGLIFGISNESDASIKSIRVDTKKVVYHFTLGIPINAIHSEEAIKTGSYYDFVEIWKDNGFYGIEVIGFKSSTNEIFMSDATIIDIYYI